MHVLGAGHMPHLLRQFDAVARPKIVHWHIAVKHCVKTSFVLVLVYFSYFNVSQKP